MVKPINMLKDVEQAKILHAVAAPVIGMPDDVRHLINDLIETAMVHPNCIGLSSNQIWDDPLVAPPAVFIIKGNPGPMVFINPAIDKQWKKEIKSDEGCMSMPGFRRNIVRPRHIQISYYDVEGAFHTGEDLFDMSARIFLHEYDHLQGTMIDGSTNGTA